MSIYALSLNGTVAEVFTPPAGVPITACFCASMTWVDVTAAFPQPQPGWSYNGTTFAPPPPPPPPTPAQQAAAMLGAGCAIASAGTPALNGTYATDPQSQLDVQAEIISILLNGTFTNGTGSIAWPDVTGAAHTLNSAHFKKLATALGAFVGTLKVIASTNAGAFPAQPSVIA